MKILHVINSLDCGGLEKFVIDLSVELKKRGHDVQLVCLQKGGDLNRLAQATQLSVTTFEKKKEAGIDFSLISKIAEFIRREKFDIIHTHNVAPLIYGSLAAAFAFNTRLINTRHGRQIETVNPLFWALNKKIVTISHDAKECLLNWNRMNPNKVKVIHNGINVEAFGSTLSEDEKRRLKIEVGIKDDSFVLGTIGRLAKEKDQATLLKAFRKMIQKKVHTTLVIVGDGPLKKDLEKMAEEFQIKDQVKLLGYRSDTAKLLQIFDVFVLSSFTEGISLALLEAMAAGKPTIATKVGGNPEVVVEAETGYLVPCGFPERIEAAAMRYFANRSLIPQMGDAGRRRALEFFSLDRMTSEYEKLYKEIAS